MTKKSLEDLLREEAGKPLDSEDSDGALSELDLNPLPTEIPHPRRANPTKAELETTVTELQEALQAAYQNQTSLQQRVTDLQSELQEQKTLVEKLQAVLEHTDQLKAELEEAKAVILQLSEANSKTTQDDIRKGSKDVVGSQALTSSKTTQDDIRKGSKDIAKSQALSLRQPPLHLTHLPPTSKKLTDKDIGWFD